MKNVLIVGAGKGGSALLKILMETKSMNVKAVVDKNIEAVGIKLAKQYGITALSDWKKILDESIDIIIETTGEEDVFEQIRDKRHQHTVLIPASVASIISSLIQDKEQLINQLKTNYYMQNIILHSTQDGMIAINKEEKVTLFNKSAERMTGLTRQDVLNQSIASVLPASLLPTTLHTGHTDLNQELIFENGLKVITTRTPIIDDEGNIIGAFAVFKDITEIEEMAKEVTNLKSIQTMLQAIIQSSDEAISVVDEQGKGLMINPAYTRITGLSEAEIIGMPATTDISEGESMHLQVLRTRKPVRGVRMKVGPKKRDVIVNVAPVIVDGKLKGSVGVIHDVSEISTLTDELKRARQIIRTLEAKYTFDDIIGQSEEIIFAIKQAKLSATTPATVLLRGESGTGKELFAHAIHNESERKYRKFVRVNCAAITESLLESELFGYEEGAFSGAKRGGKRGLFEEANGGSIFLDEIGELASSTQAKLLRVLQEGEIIRVGGTTSIPIDVRVIAATNVNLEKRISEGTFREDLYYRLNRMPIHIPPLRNRKQDIAELCNHLIIKINQDYGRNVEGLTEDALALLSNYDWPGNVRELENILGRAIINMQFSDLYIKPEHLSLLTLTPVSKKKERVIEQAGEVDGEMTLTSMIEEYEKKIIKKVLQEKMYNKTLTAKALGVSLRNLYYKIEKYEIEKNDTQ
ncbi:sigma 54-interacting transcriptional regulator [Bacillus taeanensis]|uniref:Sigma-54-dependent Fis family transcriptional regulator n=1 Tax=Bacillus taeanensis TaxID=273032 RepID=A0A366XW44_9BACI|nr:sigma 54-interacting transcriptional regulator [Bacillus taeanensis]RBW70620.1 sigma-54-dependent Fis family transcriptional regulator [Bacillus taeanensis]